MNEYPHGNFADPIPRKVEDFRREIIYRENEGESVLLVTVDGEPAGLIGYYRSRKEVIQFHGICFAKQLHGSGIPLAAVQKFLVWAFKSGAKMVIGTPFEDNARTIRFLSKLGAVRDNAVETWEGTREGKPIKTVGMVIHADQFQKNRGRGLDPSCLRQSSDVLAPQC
jgi:RimJ/RimL family protein N-acetyltransferase